MPLAKDQILALIPGLTPKEAAEVFAALRFVGALKEAPEKGESSDWVLFGLTSYLQKRGLLSGNAHLRISRTKTYKMYKEKLPALLSFLEGVEKQASTTTRHRPKLAFLCAKALAEYLEQRTIFSVSAMLSQIDKIPEAMDQAYPGYLQAGLFRFVLDQYREGSQI